MANDFSGDSNCKALWRFESGALTTDDIGSNTLTNYASRVSVDTDAGDYREGSASAYFDVSSSPRLYINDADLDSGFPLKSTASSADFSLCLWFKLDDVSDNHILVAKNVYIASNDETLLLYTRDYGSYYGIRVIKGYNSGNSSETWDALTSLDLQAGRWYHLGLTWDDSAKQFHIVVWDDTAQTQYTDSETQTYSMSLTTSPLNLGCRANSSGIPDTELNGWLDEVVVFSDILTETEIDSIRQGTYGAGGTEHELQSSTTLTSGLSADLAVQRRIDGSTGATSSAIAILDCLSIMAGACAAQSHLNSVLTTAGPVALAGTVDLHTHLNASLLRFRPSSQATADWLQEALLNGMTSDASKLGTILTGGWFWTRRAGCMALYRGPTIAQIDFKNIVCVADSDADEITTPDGLQHEADSVYCYLVRRFNSCGVPELTNAAAVRVRIDSDGNLAEPVPNGIYGLNARVLAGDKVRLGWFYCPLSQEVPPSVFRVYADEALQSELAAIPYQGRRFYSYLSDSLPNGSHVFVVVAESASGIQSLAVSRRNILVRTCSPTSMTLLSAEAIAL